MEWIFLFSGLLILLMLNRKSRQPALSYRETRLEGTLQKSMEATANQVNIRGTVRERIAVSILPQLERSIGNLNKFSADELLPAAEQLCVNGRFLQEEAIKALQEQRTLPRLPRTTHNQSRISVFAETFLLFHDFAFTPEEVTTALSAWQNVSPLTETELHSLPQIMQFRLLEKICYYAGQCDADQRSHVAAYRFHLLYKHGKRRAAHQIIQRFGNHPAFCEALLHMDESRDWLSGISEEWLDKPEVLAPKEQLRQNKNQQTISNIIHSLRLINQLSWDTLLENASVIHHYLRQDPVYEQMDAESRTYYRMQASKIAHQTHLSESFLCKGLLELCKRAPVHSVAAHTGYYLLDEGVPALLSHLHRLSFTRRTFLFFQKHALIIFRLIGWILFGSLFVLSFRWRLPVVLLIPFAFLFTLSIQQPALRLLPSKQRKLPRIALDQLSPDNQILVVCPTVLTNAQQAIAAVKHLSVMHASNPDKHVHFLLLGDFQDSLTATLSTDAALITAASSAIRTLCEDTGHLFFYLQRERIYSSTEKTYLCRGRKHGALELVLKLICGRAVQDRLAFSSFDPASLKGKYRYVILADNDTIMTPGSVLQMAGAMMHPLQKRQQWNQKIRGASIIQPQTQTSFRAFKTLFSQYISPIENGFPARDMERLFSTDAVFEDGGIIDPEPFLNETEGAVPEGKLLNPFPVEAAFAGCVSANDIKFYQSTCTNMNQWAQYLHKHTRSVWQFLPYAISPIALFSRKKLKSSEQFKLRLDVFRSLVAPLQLLLLFYTIFSGRELMAASVALFPYAYMLLYTRSLKSVCRFLCSLALLPCEAFIRTDAAARSLYRMLISHQHFLEDAPAAQLTHIQSEPSMLFFTLNMSCAGLCAAFALLFDGALVGLLLALLWAAFPFLLPHLEQNCSNPPHLTSYMRDVLTRLARNTLTFFETVITERDNALPPENVQIEPNKGIAHTSAPSAIGLYLCSLIAAEKLGLLSAQIMKERMDATIRTLEMLPKWHGLLYNHYDTRTLVPLSPMDISSEQCGILAACLLTCAQGIRTLSTNDFPDTYSLAGRLDSLCESMQLERLYDPHTYLFFTSIDAVTDIPSESHHELLAGESRLLSYVAIMQNQVPISHWQHLSRQQAVHGALLSQYGSMVEYLLPVLFQPLIPGTLLSHSCEQVLKAQRRHRLGKAYGISKSACYQFDSSLFYLQKNFGLSDFAQKPDVESNVLAPYASMLCLSMDAKGAFRSLQRMQRLGLEGPLGLFEAADFSKNNGGKMRIVRSYTALHQGMILCSLCNVLTDGYLSKLFSSLPSVQAYQVLLEEPFTRKPSMMRHSLG